MISDYRYHRLDVLRDYLSLVTYPLQWIENVPIRMVTMIRQYTRSYKQLMEENEKLMQEHFLQSAKLQKLIRLEAENARLRALLKSSPRKNETFLGAEIIRNNSNPFIHRIILDKGTKHGILLGQPVIDGNGIIGEVIEVHPLVSHVILLTDANYGIPVENARNGVRGIAAGTGSLQSLELRHVANTLDLKVGDALVTSGLDGRYPSGYPVGVINNIEQDPSESFNRITITPTADFEQARHVLLIQRCQDSEE